MVQDYRKPDYAVELTVVANAYVHEDEVVVDIDTRYFFGQPVSGAELDAKVYRLSRNGYDEWWKEIDFNTGPLKAGDYVWEKKIKSVSVPTADANGHTVLKFSANIDHEQYYYCRSSWRTPRRECYMGIEVTADDGSGQPVTASKVIRVYNMPLRYTMDTGEWLKKPGKELNVVITATHLNGKPATEQEAGIHITGYSDNWKRRFILRFNGKTGLDGKLVIPVNIEDEGYFEVELTEPYSEDSYYQTTDWIDVDSGSSQSG